jgi:hypothetical protein
VRSERGCLGGLPSTTRELLGLRAGLEGSPLSRSEAASQLGLSGRTAARIESRGLRALHLACGGSGGGGTVPARLVSLASNAPALQPASYLPMASAPALKPASQLHKSRGEQAAGTESSSHPFTGGDGPGPVSAAAATAAALGDDGSGGPGPGLIIAMCLATLVALMLFALRRRAVARQRGATMTPAVATAAAAPAAVAAPAHDHAPAESEAPTTTFAAPPIEARPAETGWTGPSADPPEAAALKPSEQAAHRDAPSRISRTATVVASSVVSFAVRELARRRRRR